METPMAGTTHSARVDVGCASRRGSRDHNCDGVSIYHAPDGAVTAAVIDGTGNSAELAHLADTIATLVTRVAARRGGLAALLTAADLLHDEYNAAAVTVHLSADGDVYTHWIGDCRAWWWTGTELRQLTTDHTMGQLLRVSGGEPAEQVAATHDHWIRLGLAEATPASVAEVRALDAEESPLAAGHLILLTSDGIHDQVPHDTLTDLIRAHTDSQALADALVSAPSEQVGYRDDATAVVLAVATDRD
jgi:serine/threonine protein phosphatase PrpC